MNLLLHYFVIKGKVKLNKKERELIYTLSALHPVQDDYVDNANNVCQKTLHALTKKLQGETVANIPDKRAQKIFDLVDIIYKHYPPRKHKNLVTIFSQLNIWQIKSQEQKKNKIEDISKILEISFMKGGYAFAFYGYVVNGSLDILQFKHFFAMGAIFQLMDDLHDLKDDINSNTTTIWTYYNSINKKLDIPMKGFLAIQEKFENITNTKNNFKYPALVRLIELVGVRYDTFRFYCLQKDFFSDKFNSLIQQQFPFDISKTVSFFSKTREHEDVNLYLKKISELDKIIEKLQKKWF